jgi:hypothetical protein
LAEAGGRAESAVRERLAPGSALDQAVESALAQPHPDTAVARALEEAVA